MTQAAEQCRTYIETKYEGVRVGRLSCRLTASGGVSQHSAYDDGGYDSNALDIFGPEPLPYVEERAFVNAVVEDLLEHAAEWSIRKILWNVPDHYGHAHVDFWPMMIDPRKWCGSSTTPTWRHSDDTTITTRDPVPESGEYHGPTEGDDMTYEQFRVAEFDLWSDENIVEAYDAGMFQDPNRDGFIAYWVNDRDKRTDAEKARFMTDYYAHLWR